jgi:hypothetical protein
MEGRTLGSAPFFCCGIPTRSGPSKRVSLMVGRAIQSPPVSNSPRRLVNSRRLFPALVALALSSACASNRVNVDAAAVLWLPAGAEIQPDLASPIAVRKGRSLYVDGSAAVTFALIGDREDVSRQVTAYFQPLAWRQRASHDMNPERHTSFEIGWDAWPSGIVQLDANGRPVPRDTGYEWHGEWENVGGDLVTYTFWAEGRQLRGYASYAPASVVLSRRAMLARVSR